MKEKDLIELLRSTIESDAIVSRLFNLYHIEYKYTLEKLNKIIDYGVQNNYFTIENVNDGSIKYTEIDWKADNTYQEILMINKDSNIKQLFSGKGSVPDEFCQFIDNEWTWYSIRSSDVVVYINKATGNGAYYDFSGNFIGGWKLSAEQLQFHIKNGVSLK